MREWTYDVVLSGRMTHTLQVQSNSPSADFNLYVIGPDGDTVAEDSGPEAGAECTISTHTTASYKLRIELVSGDCGFSMNVSSRASESTHQQHQQQQPPSSSSPHLGHVEQAAGLKQGEPAESTGAAVGSALRKEEIEGLLAAHNEWRGKYNCKPLEWSEELAAFAQEWADVLGASGMRMKHRSPNEFGENLFWCAGKKASAQEVVDAWGNEVEFYSEAENNWWPKAGHFSQVVWHSTTHVGGGVVRRDGQELWVCNYNPRGNWSGQRPYSV